MGAIGEPVNPFEFVVCWDALHRLVADTKDRVLGGILWEVKLNPWNNRECLFYSFPEGITDPLGSLSNISQW